MSEEQHITDLIPAYVLDSLNEGECVQVETHLKACATCRADLEDYRQIAAQLAFSAPQVEPPPALRQKLMSSVQPKPKQPPQDTQPGLWQQIAQAFNRPVPAWGALAVAILVLAVSIGLWQMDAPATVSPEGSTMRAIAMLGTEAAPEAQGLIIIGSEGVEGALVVEDLPALEPDQQYQLWLIKDGQRTSGAVFSVDEDGYTAFMLSSSIPLSQYTAFGITLEPEGGSPGPTGPKILGGSF